MSGTFVQSVYEYETMIYAFYRVAHVKNPMVKIKDCYQSIIFDLSLYLIFQRVFEWHIFTIDKNNNTIFFINRVY